MLHIGVARAPEPAKCNTSDRCGLAEAVVGVHATETSTCSWVGRLLCLVVADASTSFGDCAPPPIVVDSMPPVLEAASSTRTADYTIMFRVPATL